jgi:hypothetical protein
VYDSVGLIRTYDRSYKLMAEISIVPCVVGQEISLSTGVCNTCPLNFYSLNLTSSCQKCKTQIMSECPGGNVIDVRPGFWRIHNLTDEIEECVNYPDNCLGGRLNNTCIEGNIGGLCEVCDFYGEVGPAYSNSE